MSSNGRASLCLGSKQNAKGIIPNDAPNTACTRLVGVGAFSGSFLVSRLVPAKWRYLVPPTSG